MTDRHDVNWAGNVTYGAERVVAPASVEQLSDLVRTSSQVKAVGSRHCFNTIADTAGTQIAMNRMPADLQLDGARRTVRVAAGLRYGDIAPRLHREGWALSNLASLPHISIAGAVATGTHGSGDATRSLAAAVTGLELVTADGDVRTLRRGDPDFAGAIVSLGALGIVTAIELEIEPAYELAQTVYERLPVDAVLADLGSVTGLGQSVSMFTTWRDPDTIDMLWVKSRGAVPEEVVGARRADGPRHPLPGVDPRSCSPQLGEPGPWYERLPHFRLDFTPSNGDELQSEYLVPRSRAVEAIEAMRRLAPDVSPLLQVCELRTIAADDLWLSPAYGTDLVGIHLTWVPDQAAVEAVIPAIEAELYPLGGRPHWGKVFATDGFADQLPSMYPRWGDFAALRERMDPRGVFRNDYLATLGL